VEVGGWEHTKGIQLLPTSFLHTTEKWLIKQKLKALESCLKWLQLLTNSRPKSFTSHLLYFLNGVTHIHNTLMLRTVNRPITGNH